MMGGTGRRLKSGYVNRRDLFWEIVRFGVVGGASAAVYAVTIVACIYLLDMRASISTVPAYIVSMAVNYTLQKSWTFRNDVAHMASLPKYLFVHAVGIAINYGTVEAAVTGLGAPYLPAQVVAVGLVACWSYMAQKYWAFAVRRLG